MPNNQRPAYDWPIRLTLTCIGKKPRLADWPGLDTDGMLCARLPGGRRLWRFTLYGRFAN